MVLHITGTELVVFQKFINVYAFVRTLDFAQTDLPTPTHPINLSCLPLTAPRAREHLNG